jgi:hypothetical protein
MILINHHNALRTSRCQEYSLLYVEKVLASPVRKKGDGEGFVVDKLLFNQRLQLWKPSPSPFLWHTDQKAVKKGTGTFIESINYCND